MTNRRIRISIRGKNAETGAPAADDLIAQMRDYLDIMQGVEKEYAPDNGDAVVWRITDAGKNSPLNFEWTAFPRRYAVNIDHHVDAVMKFTATGLNTLQQRADRPRYFTDNILKKAGKVFERVTNGLDVSEIDFVDTGLPPHRLTPETARAAQRNTSQVLTPDRDARPYHELGSFEGDFISVSRDGHGHSILHVRHRLTGENIKCVLSESALPTVEDHKIREVLEGRRVRVSGNIDFKSLGRISRAEISHVAFFRRSAELPNAEDIIDPDFTGGLSTEEYLGRVRNGELS